MPFKYVNIPFCFWVWYKIWAKRWSVAPTCGCSGLDTRMNVRQNPRKLHEQNKTRNPPKKGHPGHPNNNSKLLLLVRFMLLCRAFASWGHERMSCRPMPFAAAPLCGSWRWVFLGELLWAAWAHLRNASKASFWYLFGFALWLVTVWFYDFRLVSAFPFVMQMVLGQVALQLCNVALIKVGHAMWDVHEADISIQLNVPLLDIFMEPNEFLVQQPALVFCFALELLHGATLVQLKLTGQSQTTYPAGPLQRCDWTVVLGWSWRSLGHPAHQGFRAVFTPCRRCLQTWRDVMQPLLGTLHVCCPDCLKRAFCKGLFQERPVLWANPNPEN